MKLYDVIASTLRPDSYIIQFSPIRTGSTLIYNILRDLFPHKTIKKTHSYDPHYRRLKIVGTIRHPLDCIASTIKTKSKTIATPPSDEIVRDAMREFDNSGIDDIIEITKRPNACVFKYEEFIQSLDPVYDAIEQFFGRHVTASERNELNAKYNVDEVYKKTSSLGDFSKWDPVTHLHGNHISDTKGKPDVYRTFFSPSQIDELKQHYQHVMEQFGYDLDS